MPLFTKDDTETLTSIITTICEAKKKAMEIEDDQIMKEPIDEEDELKQNQLMINAITIYLMKFNDDATTTDLVLIDNLIETLSLLFEDALQYSKGKELIISFDNELREKECSLSLINYIYSQLPLIDQIIDEMKANQMQEDEFDIHYYPKQQATYANLLYEPKIIPFDPQV